MKFSFKLLLSTVTVMAIVFGCSGFYYVNYVFKTALDREAGQALDESSILRFAFETAALNAPAKYDVLQDNVVEQITSNLEAGGHDNSRLLRICDEKKKILYASQGFEADRGLLEQTGKDTKTYRIIQVNNKNYIQTGIAVDALNRTLYLETMKDVSEVFKERTLGFLVYRRVTVIMLLCGAILMYVISFWLTRPIRLLTKATERMADGDLTYRANQVSGDELGQLTMDFNDMADALEHNVHKLEEEVRSREEFVAAFAHELKTPLTAIIGYADMLRSRKMDAEKQFLSANYIYTEGRRLETMAFRLLDIIVTKRYSTEFQVFPVQSLFSYLEDMYAFQNSMEFFFQYEEAMVKADQSLLQSVLLNLIDNACKASEAGNRIEVTGHLLKSEYCFEVRDYGIGIPAEEQKKITKAFYMVDKSRSRSRNGAGLGLTLCEEILQLHDSRLKIESVPGKGTCVSFVLAACAEEG